MLDHGRRAARDRARVAPRAREHRVRADDGQPACGAREPRRPAHLHGRRVVASIFVNPLQFGPNEDFAAYPRTPDDDVALLPSRRRRAVPADRRRDVPEGQRRQHLVDVPELSNILCGAFRPGHFEGVATVVAKLLNLVQPDVAIFGEKDYQQLRSSARRSRTWPAGQDRRRADRARRRTGSRSVRATAT